MLSNVRSIKALNLSKFLTEESAANLVPGFPGGVAFDGTNFLAAAQSTNGTIMTIRLATNGFTLGLPLDLGRTGGVPRVAFDGVNYLIAWPDFSEGSADIYGEFIAPDNTAVGSPFLIQPDADASELGGLAFDGRNYLAVWEANARQSNAVPIVEGRLISPAGELPGPRLEISDSTTPQKFPDVAWNGESFLVVWTGQTEGINEWSVRGARLNATGMTLARIAISANPAQQPWPPTVASDGTNWLTVWCRETGPHLVLNSNLWLPMLYGRIVAKDGTVSGDEIQIRWGGLGQFKPQVSFNGDTFLVGWMEKTRADQNGPPPFIGWYWRPALRQLNSFGEPIMSEFVIRRSFYNPTVDPLGLKLGAGAHRFLLLGEGVQNRPLWDSTLFVLNRSFALCKYTNLPTGDIQFDLVGPKSYSYGIEVTTNWIHWNPVVRVNGGGNSYPTGRVTVPAALALSSRHSFFRAFDGQTACRENLRLIQQAQDHWALEKNEPSLETPADSDLFGAGGYLPAKPICPNGGTYFLEYMLSRPSCSLGTADGHTY